jgi:hypothetical protein
MVFEKGQASSGRQRKHSGLILGGFGIGLLFRRNRCNEKEEIADARRLQEASFQGNDPPMDICELRASQSFTQTRLSFENVSFGGRKWVLDGGRVQTSQWRDICFEVEREGLEMP